jgi:ABC-2 type transport system ATP-binding protein
LQEVVVIDKGELLLHEEAEALRARGTAVTGKPDAVDRFAIGRTVLSEKQLGSIKQVAVFGELDECDRDRAKTEGLELGLQDLFVHLTDSEESK